MTDVVQVTREGPMALVALNNPPVNAAGHALRLGLVGAITTLEAEEDIRVIVLYGQGRSFIAGADIREFGKPPRDPWLPEVCNRLELCNTPVISVLHGAALGGGLEVAIATHARVAIPGVQVGFPEVTLGVLPGAGGTQRAPRLIGIRPALDLIVSGKRVDAQTALRLGLVDRIADGAPRDIARNAGRDVLSGTLPTRRTRDIGVTPDTAAIDDVRTRIATTQAHLFSPARCVEAVAQAARPIDEGLRRERELFQQCMESPQRAGLIHAFFAERAVAKIPEAGTPPRPIESAGVIGAGTMGAGIATACLLAGLPVTLVEQDANALARGQAAIETNLDGAVARGKLTSDARQRLELTTGLRMDALAGCDLVIEAAFEDMDVKRTLFERLGQIAKPGAVLASNTSYLDLDQIAGASGRAGDVIGLHFFSPAHVMRLLEVVVGAETAPDVATTGFALARRLRKVAVRSGVCDGFIGNRIMNRYRQAADFLVLDGAQPADIDAALRAFGFAMGPFEVSDLAGLDIAWANRRRLADTRDPATRYHGGVADKLCDAGQFGRKTGIGFYDHRGDQPVPNPALPALIAAERARLGITPRTIPPNEIVTRYLAAMVMEATRVVEEGIALRPIDVDAVFLFGYGFPRWKGGPMHHADTLGAAAWVAQINALAKDDPAFWQVPPLLARMAETGRTFADLNPED